MTALDWLKDSETGMTQEEIDAKARRCGVNADEVFFELGGLVTRGLARFDENPVPGRFKATKLAWEENSTQ